MSSRLKWSLVVALVAALVFSTGFTMLAMASSSPFEDSDPPEEGWDTEKLDIWSGAEGYFGADNATFDFEAIEWKAP